MNSNTDKIDSMIAEEWRDIKGYEGLYKINNKGDVFSVVYQRMMRPVLHKNGYLGILLSHNGNRKFHLVHRLVAATFIPNPSNLPQVDHIDTDKTNNNVNNLRWVTEKENSNNPLSLLHSGESRKGDKHYLYGKHLSDSTKKKMSNSHKGKVLSKEWCENISKGNKGKNLGRYGSLHPASKSVIQTTKDGVIRKVWGGVSEASRALGISTTSISNCLTGRNKTAGGYIWTYNQ